MSMPIVVASPFSIGFDAKPAIGSQDHLGVFGRIVAVDLVDMDEILQKQRKHVLRRCRLERFGGVLGPGLDEGGDPLHEGFPYKLVLAPAIQIDEATHLSAGDHGQQVQAVGQADSLDGKEDFLERGGLHQPWRIVA